MTIIFNGQLAHCEINGLCNYFLDRSSGINIWRNGKTCSSREEIQLPCTQSDPVRSTISDEVRVFPNRTSDVIFIEGIEQTRHRLQIVSSAGEILHDTYVVRNQRIDLSRYPDGIYFVSLRSKDNQISLPITKW